MTAATTAGKADDVEVMIPKPSDPLKVRVNTAEDVEGDSYLVEVRIKRLRTMELLGILRILTTAFGASSLGQLQLNTESPEKMQADMVAMLFMAIPNAAWEFVDLVQSITDPTDPSDEDALRAELKNPEAEALLDIVEVVCVQEAPSLHSLVGKLRSLWERVGSLYIPKSRQKKGAGSAKRSTS